MSKFLKLMAFTGIFTAMIGANTSSASTADFVVAYNTKDVSNDDIDLSPGFEICAGNDTHKMINCDINLSSVDRNSNYDDIVNNRISDPESLRGKSEMRTILSATDTLSGLSINLGIEEKKSTAFVQGLNAYNGWFLQRYFKDNLMNSTLVQFKEVSLESPRVRDENYAFDIGAAIMGIIDTINGKSQMFVEFGVNPGEESDIQKVANFLNCIENSKIADPKNSVCITSEIAPQRNGEIYYDKMMKLEFNGKNENKFIFYILGNWFRRLSELRQLSNNNSPLVNCRVQIAASSGISIDRIGVDV